MKKGIRDKNIIMLFIGGFISNIGDMMYNLALTITLYTASQSITPVAIMFLARGVLRIPIQYLSGILADNFNRKYIIIVTNIISVPVALSLVLMNKGSLWIGYVVAFLLQSLNDIDICSENSILPELVKKEELAEVNSIFSVLGKIAIFISPALAGLLYKSYGTTSIFIINSLTFLIAGLAFTLIKYIPQNTIGSNKSNILASGFKGFKLIKSYGSVILIFIVMSSFSLLGMMYEVMKVAVSDINLELGADGIIYFGYALAIGGLVSPLIVKFIKKKEINIFIVASLVVAFTYIVWSSTHNIYISFIILIIAGLFKSIQGIYSTTIIQKDISNQYIGRIFALYKMILTLTAMIGISLSPILYRFIGIRYIFLLFSLLAILLSSFALVYNMKKNTIKITN
ncbi:MAG: MFS transporter [Firmicutes bacterium]|nr:MFS transporter [Bacillota bacterium]